MRGREDGWALEVEDLTKRFGPVLAVDRLSFVVRPGRVTGFLGPNGAGKTTTLRCLLGLVRPTAGRTSVGGRPYRDLDHPLRTVGAALEAASFHPGRTARAHLQVMAAAGGVASCRVGEVLALTGLEEHADRRTGGYSLGMRQRLGLAQALLGDPGVLVLDEPANGLDPAGIAWLRQLLRTLAAEGRTVLVSSHVLAEVHQTADDVVVLARGRLVAEGPLAALEASRAEVRVRAPDPGRLATALAEHLPDATAHRAADGSLTVVGATSAQVGHAAYVAGVELHELAALPGELERLFLDLTRDAGR